MSDDETTPVLIETMLKRFPCVTITATDHVVSEADFLKQEKKHERTGIGGVALAILTLGDGRIVLTQRTHPPYVGWGLPGGGVEHGESFETALLREIQEECGVAARISDLLSLEIKTFSSSKGRSLTMTLAVFRAVSSEDLPSEQTALSRVEGLAVQAFRRDQLPTQLVLGDGDKLARFLSDS